MSPALGDSVWGCAEGLTQHCLHVIEFHPLTRLQWAPERSTLCSRRMIWVAVQKPASSEGREGGASCGSVESELFCEQELVWIYGTFLTSGMSQTVLLNSQSVVGLSPAEVSMQGWMLPVWRSLTPGWRLCCWAGELPALCCSLGKKLPSCPSFCNWEFCSHWHPEYL